MDCKRVFLEMLWALLFLALAFVCFWLVAANPGWMQQSTVLPGSIFLLGFIFLAMTVDTVFHLKVEIFPKPKERGNIMEERGRLLQYKAKKENCGRRQQ